MQLTFYIALLSLILCNSFAHAQEAKAETNLTASQDTFKINQVLSQSKQYVYSNPLKMNEEADKALRFSQDINYERGVAMALCYIGQAKLQLAEYNEALSFLLSALEIAERLKYEACIGLTFKLMGHIYLHQNDVDRAEEHYEKSLVIAQKTSNNELIAGIQNGIGNVFAARKDYKRALEAYFLAQKIAQKLDDKSKIADIESNIGRIYLAQGMNSLAIEFFQKGLETAKKFNNLEEVADNSLILSTYYLQKILPDNALIYAEISLDAAERMKAKFLIQKCLSLLSEIYGQKEEYKKAYDYNQRSKVLQDSILGKDYEQQYAAITAQYENQAKDKERIINQLQLEQKNKDLQNQQKITYIFLASSIIFIGLSILAFMLYRNQYKAVKQIQTQNRQIIAQNDEINIKSQEINAQKRAIEDKNEDLEMAYHEIEKKNESIMASISYAKRIQTALLPDQEEVNTLFPQSFVYYKPKDVISGDFYYLTEVRNRVIIAVADCTGHGVPGAFMSVLGVQSLNKIIQSGIISPDKILGELHKEIRQVLKQQMNEVRDGMDIILCVVNKEQKTLEYAGAINPLYYIQFTENQLAEFFEIKATKRTIGGFQRDEEERFFDKHTIDISIPTTFYLATDGYRDQFGGENNKKFMARRFKEMLFHIQDKPMQVQQQIVDEVITKWLGKNAQIDDMLVVGIKI
jgi:serine phosphatase RsbU (regulator of sigma subunit)